MDGFKRESTAPFQTATTEEAHYTDFAAAKRKGKHCKKYIVFRMICNNKKWKGNLRLLC